MRGNARVKRHATTPSSFRGSTRSCRWRRVRRRRDPAGCECVWARTSGLCLGPAARTVSINKGAALCAAPCRSLRRWWWVVHGAEWLGLAGCAVCGVNPYAPVASGAGRQQCLVRDGKQAVLAYRALVRLQAACFVDAVALQHYMWCTVAGVRAVCVCVCACARERLTHGDFPAPVGCGWGGSGCHSTLMPRRGCPAGQALCNTTCTCYVCCACFQGESV